MSRVIANSKYTIKRLLRPKGQGIVEFALIMAFCAGVGLFVRDAGFRDVLNASYSGSKPSLQSNTVAEIGDIYRIDILGNESIQKKYEKMLRQYGEKSRGQLITVTPTGQEGEHYDISDIVSSNERLAADQGALANIANAFIGYTRADLKSDAFFGGKNEFNKAENINYLNNNGKILLASYYDDKDFTVGEDGTVTFDDKPSVRIVGERTGISANDLVHWMRGDYGTITEDSNGKKIRTYDEDYSANFTVSKGKNDNLKNGQEQYSDTITYYATDTRYFFSDGMINPSYNDPPNGKIADYDAKRNIRIHFQFDNTDNKDDTAKVIGVKIYMQQAGGNALPGTEAKIGTYYAK